MGSTKFFLGLSGSNSSLVSGVLRGVLRAGIGTKISQDHAQSFTSTILGASHTDDAAADVSSLAGLVSDVLRAKDLKSALLRVGEFNSSKIFNQYHIGNFSHYIL